MTEFLLMSVEGFLLLFVSFDFVCKDLFECSRRVLMPHRVLVLYGVLRRGRGGSTHTTAMVQENPAVSVPREIVGPRRVGDDLGAPEVQSERRKTADVLDEVARLRRVVLAGLLEDEALLFRNDNL